MNINKLWLRRQTTKFNGVPYVVQRAAAAVFTESGMAEIQSNLDYYRKNAKGHRGRSGRVRRVVLRRQEQPLHLAALPR